MISKKMRYCSSCESTKPIGEFYKKQHYCIECQKEQQKQANENRRNRIILTLVEHEVIEKEYIEAAKLLFDSCASRMNDCNKNSGYYHDNNIKCDWDSIEEFFIDCFEIVGFWDKWKEQYLIYKDTKQKNSRPTIDRLDEKGNYSKDNIGVLSHLENVRKAQQKPCYAVIIKDKRFIGKFEFDSKTDFINKLNELIPSIPSKVIRNIPFDTGLVHEIDDTYSIILQSKNINKNEIGKDITEPQYEFIFTNHRRLYIDSETNEVVKVEKLPINPQKLLVNKLVI